MTLRDAFAETLGNAVLAFPILMCLHTALKEQPRYDQSYLKLNLQQTVGRGQSRAHFLDVLTDKLAKSANDEL